MTIDLRPRVSDAERIRRWRLVLGGGDGDGTDVRLRGDDRRIDAALGALYDQGDEGAAAAGRQARLVASAAWRGLRRP